MYAVGFINFYFPETQLQNKSVGVFNPPCCFSIFSVEAYAKMIKNYDPRFTAFAYSTLLYRDLFSKIEMDANSHSIR